MSLDFKMFWQQLAHLARIYWIALALFAYLMLYLYVRTTSMTGTPPEALKLSPKRWSKKQMLDAYEKAKRGPIDVTSCIPPKTGRRYIVVGGSGLVGGWIVQHLLMRGEDPAAIRVVDILPLRPDAVDRHIEFVKTDISDAKSVKDAFDAEWPHSVAKLPLTVFHTAAIIDSKNRAEDLLGPFLKVNTEGTRHVLNASKAAGANILIATSSSSVGVKSVDFFPPIWQRHPTNYIQVSDNATPVKPAAEMKHDEYCGNYAKTKHLAETLVLEADNNAAGFRTGCIRPGHAIYGQGVASRASFVWTGLSMGGFPSWLHDVVQHFVNAQNVSIAHLLYESKLLDSSAQKSKDIGGRAYAVTDSNEPRTFDDIYTALATLTKSPISFPRIPAFPMVIFAYIVEAYVTFQRRYASFLPPVTGDTVALQPATMRVSTVHFVVDTARAKQDLGYNGPISTLDGLAAEILDWNQKLDAKKIG